MREVLDRLREAETRLDQRLVDLYYEGESQGTLRAMRKLWKAKKSIWHAQVCVLDAAAGHQTPVPTGSKPVSYEGAAAAYRDMAKPKP